ncbi:hypothetical protein FQN49_008134, partial [Arthroderma sp. PD_2]
MSYRLAFRGGRQLLRAPAKAHVGHAKGGAARTGLYSIGWSSSQSLSRQCPPALALVRHYANGRPHPPGGTHRMNLGGEPEKPALEQFGVDLTA